MVKKSNTLKGVVSKGKVKGMRAAKIEPNPNKPKVSGKNAVKTAKDLGIAAQSFGIAKKAKTHKGRKIIENRAPKLIENPKRSVILKGRKSSAEIS